VLLPVVWWVQLEGPLWRLQLLVELVVPVFLRQVVAQVMV
jgi:hypothetical protein